ncbi:MAG: polysaccharide deacetylase family protein [Treponema sp.]|nr:polysaccharide deacetylase family protein [Treponema sp.]
MRPPKYFFKFLLSQRFAENKIIPALFRAALCSPWLILILLTAPCNANIRFSGLDLAEDNRLLFSAASSGGGSVNQSALFIAALPNRSVSMLSAFPEKMELIDGGKTIIVHNTFGSQQLPVTGGLPRSFPGFSAFTDTPGLRVESTSASSNGRWLLYVEPETSARGTLVLLDGVSGRKIRVSADIERPGRYFPALWGADSRGFLYAKEGRLYFYSVVTEAAPPDERYRVIGEGAIPSLYWDKGEVFYYLRSSTVYRVRSNELFARTLYSGFLDLGEVAGKIPFNFDPNFDRYWISPDGLSLILCKGGRNLFYYPLGIQSDTETDFASLPYIMAPRSGSRINVLWSSDGIATVLIGSTSSLRINPSASDYTAAYRLSSRGIEAASKAFQTLDNPPAFEAALSPDGSRIVFWGRDGLFLYDYKSWKLLAKPVSQPVYSCLWVKNDELIIGGEERIESVRLSGNAITERKLICLSTASRYGFEPSPSRQIAAFSGDTWYATDGENPWTAVRTPSLKDTTLVSGRYRVYLEDRAGFFENVPMIRNVVSVGTFPLFENEVKPKDRSPGIPGVSGSAAANPSIIPVSDESYVFNHGVRAIRQIALCFDIYDDSSGLSAVLDALGRFGIKATFFVNGEFIRRHPQAAKDLALSGHEIGSMFYAHMDLSDARYRIDRTFVERGLARNEDEYYKTTGRELALLWHPPYYALSKEIADAAAAVGYRTIGRDIDSRDWLPSGEARRLGIEQLSAADMIDNIVDAVQGGSIVPIRLGLLEGGRADYLFNSMEVLLDALVQEGYEIVSVSTLAGRNR